MSRPVDAVELERRMAVLGPHLYDGVALTVAARAAGVPERTARRWLTAYRAGGSAGLDRVPRSDRGTPRIPAELVELIEGLALRDPPPQMTQVHRRVAEIAAERDLAVPSYGAVRNVIKALDPGLVTLAQGGPAAYRDKFELVARRESARPNDMWQADHTELDVMILDPRGRPARPWLTTVLDDHSRAVPGYTTFLGAPSAHQTALALHQAIWRKPDPVAWPMCGIPSTLYVDNGSDFTSTHIGQVCADLHIQLIHSTPGVPRGRGKSERLFGTITTELLSGLPGFIPHGNNGKPITAPALGLAELDAAIGAWITGAYHHREHPKTHEPPAARWAGTSPWLPRMPESLDELNLLLLQVATPRKVLRDGIHLHGLHYIAATLAPYVGEPVTIRYDPRDLAEIRVWHDGVFLCVAIAPDIAGVSVSTADLIAARNARRGELRKTLTARRSLVELLTDPTARHPDPPAVSGDDDRAADTPPARKLKLYHED